MEAFELMSVMGLGFLIGLQHAFEADHIAAVSTMATQPAQDIQPVGAMRRGTRVGRASLMGAAWGLGHTTTLLAMGMAVLFFKLSISESLAVSLEKFVGVMLVFLGVSVWVRLRRDKIHLHAHEHDGTRHAHLHSHQFSEAHEHGHLKRSYLIGMVHGLAGSASLMVLVLASLETVFVGLVYILIFGMGSVVGMTFVAALIGATVSKLNRVNRWIQFTAGAFSIIVGAGSIL